MTLPAWDEFGFLRDNRGGRLLPCFTTLLPIHEIRYEDEQLHLEDLHWEIGCVWTRLVDATKLSTTIRYMIDDISTTIRMALSSRWSSFLGAF